MAIGEIVGIPQRRSFTLHRFDGAIDGTTNRNLIFDKIFKSTEVLTRLSKIVAIGFIAVGLLSIAAAIIFFRHDILILSLILLWIVVVAAILIISGMVKPAALFPTSPRQALVTAMATHYDIGLQPVKGGHEPIGIPFPHLLFLVGVDDPEYWMSVESEAVSSLNRRWANYVDPLVGFRVRAFVSKRVEQDAVVATFGTGIFAPMPGETAVGQVEIRSAGGHSEIVQLPGGSAAGIYRGQTALAFSGKETICPATADLLADFPGVFCIRAATSVGTRRSGGSGSHGTSGYDLAWEPIGAVSSGFSPIRSPALGPEGVDAAFTIEHPDVAESFEVHLTEDIRRSRLHRRPPVADIAFAVIGMICPEAPNGRSKSWWIDCDEDGALVATSLRKPRFSIVVRNGSLSFWDWRSPGASFRYPAFLKDVQTPKGECGAVFAPFSTPFGWLTIPDDGVRAEFTHTNGHGFEVDWLDFAGAVELGGGRAERLAEWWQANIEAPSLPGRMPARDAADLLWQAPDAPGFGRGWDGRLDVGARFICGPFVLEVVEGRLR